jgi:glycine amidinotransferase
VLVDVVTTPGALAVCSWNEWDPLLEVIVGRADDARMPPLEPGVRATMPDHSLALFDEAGGRAFPPELIDAANRDLEALVALLENEGVEVRRPGAVSFGEPYETPGWQCDAGLYAAMPRDVALVVGDEIIEAPMAWRSRYFELFAFRSLFKDYFRRGARWTAAPRPELKDELYASGDAFATSEWEPTFDAADFVRCGRHIFGQRSHVTNELGIEWLRRHLAPAVEVVVVDVDDPHPMHIDATLVPLAPGKVLVNPERMRRLPPQLRNWDVRPAPLPAPRDERELHMSSAWISMNILSLGPDRVVVEQEERELAAMLRDWGFEVLECPFRAFNRLGGSFHCATLDMRRDGELTSHCDA